MTNTANNKNLMNLQDSFLNHVRKESLPVVIYLVNGFQIRGLVRGFDNFTVIIENEGKQQLVYKHAVSTISPAANITIDGDMSDWAEIEGTVNKTGNIVEVKGFADDDHIYVYVKRAKSGRWAQLWNENASSGGYYYYDFDLLPLASS